MPVLTSSMAVKVAMPLFRILTGAKATKFKSLVSYKIVTVLASSITDLNLMMTVRDGELGYWSARI